MLSKVKYESNSATSWDMIKDPGICLAQQCTTTSCLDEHALEWSGNEAIARNGLGTRLLTSWRLPPPTSALTLRRVWLASESKLKRTPMGLERVKVEGLQELLEAVEQRKGSEEKLFVLFCGSVRPETGESWCPDCVKGSLDDRIISVGANDLLNLQTSLNFLLAQSSGPPYPNLIFRLCFAYGTITITSYSNNIVWGGGGRGLPRSLPVCKNIWRGWTQKHA